jgi:hypothetical protein
VWRNVDGPSREKADENQQRLAGINIAEYFYAMQMEMNP